MEEVNMNVVHIQTMERVEGKDERIGAKEIEREGMIVAI